MPLPLAVFEKSMRFHSACIGVFLLLIVLSIHELQTFQFSCHYVRLVSVSLCHHHQVMCALLWTSTTSVTDLTDPVCMSIYSSLWSSEVSRLISYNLSGSALPRLRNMPFSCHTAQVQCIAAAQPQQHINTMSTLIKGWDGKVKPH